MNLTANTILTMEELGKKLHRENFSETSFVDTIILHVVGAIAMHPHNTVNEEINSHFEERKKEYFNEYRKSSFYQHTFFSGMPAVSGIIMKKLIGMYLYEEKNGRGKEFLLKHIISGYKRAYDYVAHNKVIDLNTLIGLYAQGQFEFISDAQRTMIGSIALYLGYPSKEILWEPMLRTQIYNMLVYSRDSKVVDSSFRDMFSENTMHSLKKFQEITGIKMGKKETLDYLLAKHEGVLINRLSPIEKKKIIRNSDYKPLYKQGLMRYWKPLGAILRLNKMNDMSLSFVPVTREDIQNIHATMQQSFELERLKEEETEFFLAASLALLMMVKQYKVVTDAYEDLFEKESGLNEILLEESFESEKRKFVENESILQQTVAEQQQILSRQEEEIAQLRKQLKEAQQHNQDYDKLKKEVVALREFVFTQENTLEQDVEEVDTLSEDIKLLEGKKITIIGGYPKWQHKIKNILPSVRFVELDELGVDLSFIANMDIVCFETTRNKHSQYDRVMNHIAEDTKFLYINEKNVNRVIRNIRTALFRD